MEWGEGGHGKEPLLLGLQGSHWFSRGVGEVLQFPLLGCGITNIVGSILHTL